MDKLEKVEKLREKTGVTYEDAKAALEACDYDMLDAIIYLEKLDKIKKPDVDKYTTESSEKGAITGVSPLRLLLLCICTYRLHQSLFRLQRVC